MPDIQWRIQARRWRSKASRRRNGRLRGGDDESWRWPDGRRPDVSRPAANDWRRLHWRHAATFRRRGRKWWRIQSPADHRRLYRQTNRNRNSATANTPESPLEYTEPFDKVENRTLHGKAPGSHQNRPMRENERESRHFRYLKRPNRRVFRLNRRLFCPNMDWFERNRGLLNRTPRPLPL